MLALEGWAALEGQVVRSLRELVALGAFLPGEALPGPEELARELVLNPRTVRGAYETLTAEGVLRAGDGVFWAADRPEDPGGGHPGPGAQGGEDRQDRREGRDEP